MDIDKVLVFSTSVCNILYGFGKWRLDPSPPPFFPRGGGLVSEGGDQESCHKLGNGSQLHVLNITSTQIVRCAIAQLQVFSVTKDIKQADNLMDPHPQEGSNLVFHAHEDRYRAISP